MDKDVSKMAQIENMVTVTVAGAVVVGLAALLGSFHCLWGLLILVNLNTFHLVIAKRKEIED